MRSPTLLLPMLRSVLALALVSAFEACGESGPLEPARELTSEPLARSAAPAAAPESFAALATAQRIAFGTFGPAVLTMDPQGSQYTAVFTHLPGARSPAWSWDNTKLAAVSARVSNGVTRDDIVVMSPDGSNIQWARTQASAWDFQDPTWAPNGSRLAATVLVAGVPTLGWIQPGTGNAGIYFFPGGGAVHGKRPAFNKGGTKILYVGPQGNTIEQINADGSGHKVRISSASPLDYPSFSPDGSRIAYQKGPAGGNTDVYVKNLATGVSTRLTFSTAADGHPTWSPDGVRIAFTTARTGRPQIYSMKSATGGDLVDISQGKIADEYDPAWTH